MLAYRAFHTPICASCRLRACIAAKQFARSRRVVVKPSLRLFSSGRVIWRSNGRRGEVGQPSARARRPVEAEDDAKSAPPEEILEVGDEEQGNKSDGQMRPEEAAQLARQAFGDELPEGLLSEEEYEVYERLYGKPLRVVEQTELEQDDLLGDLEDEAELARIGILREAEGGELEEVTFDLDEPEQVEEGAHTAEGEQDVHRTASAQERLEDDIRASMSGDGEETVSQAEESDSYQRAHPLTLANRFGTSPSTLQLPKHELVDPIEAQLSNISNTHISQAAHRVFGGIGLPYSTSTPALAKTMQQKAVALDAYQANMSEIEGDVFMAALVPGIYAAVMSVLVETRKRLGTAWAEALVEKESKNELRILDAGGGGAGVLAVRELLKAEWGRMNEETSSLDSGMALAEADGKVGGAGANPPFGHATVLTGSDVLRKRASKLLENTTFIPRLPDYVHTEEAKKKGKFDIIIAPHTLWQLREDYIRKPHMQNLWSLLSQDGGVLLVLEKGVARGFELVAGARELLLETCIKSPSSASKLPRIDDPDVDWRSEDPEHSLAQRKDKGMIIAPCTNHEQCPMYVPKGRMKGRRDICHFSQRYVRPSFLQNILGARDKNFEDVKFSYFSVMRGRDLREEKALKQDDEATDQAFQGYGEAQDVESLTLPRAVLPPLKRTGHVILDLCTPSGTLERWTVPRSFSKQAFRDARKSSWGDLWALGAKTRVPRTPKIKKRKSDADMDVRGRVTQKGSAGLEADEYGRIVSAGLGTQLTRPTPAEKGDGGKQRTQRVKGVRDKRDKKATGNGRRRGKIEEYDG